MCAAVPGAGFRYGKSRDVFSGNVSEAIVDLVNRRQDYRQEMTERHERIAEGGDVVVAPIVQKPKTIFVKDITQEQGIWQSVELARCFGRPSIPAFRTGHESSSARVIVGNRR